MDDLHRRVAEAPLCAPVGRAHGPGGAEPVPWGDPITLPVSRPTAPFCAEVLGPRVSTFVKAVAAQTATAPDIAGVAALGVVSAVITGAAVVEADMGWSQPVNLYLNVLAAPGEAKTPTLHCVARPLDELERERAQRFSRQRVEAQGLKVAESRLRHLEAVAAKATGAEQVGAEEAAAQAAQAAAAIVVPKMPRVYTREATPEGLVRLLGEQGGRLAVVTDEGSEFFQLAQRYSATGKGNLGIYLAGHDGVRYTSDRAERDAVVIDSVCLTVCLLGQPIVLEELAKDRQANGRGLLARFLWSLPASRVGYRPVHRQPVGEDLALGWQQLVLGLAREAEQITEPSVLRLCPGAKRAFDEWRESHEPKLRPTGPLASISEWGTKLPGQVLRLAGNLHAMREGTLEGTVSAETMQGALALAEYFTSHALVTFAAMRTDPAMRDAEAVLAWISERALPEVRTSDIVESKDWLADRVRGALRVLSEYAWVRSAPRTGARGRPPETWEVHPSLTGAKWSDTRPWAVMRRSAPVRRTPPAAIPRHLLSRGAV